MPDDTLLRMKEWLAEAARLRGDHPFLETADVSATFSEAHDRVGRIAGGLCENGIGPGDRVAVWAANDVDSVLAVFGVWRTGAAVQLLDPRLGDDEAEVQLAATGAKITLGSRHRESGVPSSTVSAVDGTPVARRDPTPDEPALVVFTSGSSGRPKGVRLTFANLEASAMASALHLDHRATDRWLCNLPIAHVGGASILIRSARQATTVVLEPGFDPVRAAALLRVGDATLASMVAATLARMLDVLPGRYSGVRAVLVGGGPVPDDLLARAHRAGLPVLPTYGMTETASQVATALLEDGLSADPRIVPLRGAEIRTLAGRLQVRGPMVSPGYVGERDRAPEDWFATGDLGEVDPSGRIRVLGRADDVIVTGGENVFPAEVEAVIRELASVTEVCVAAAPDPTWGSLVVAVYEGEASPAELERHVRYRLAGFKVPRRWVRVEALPRLGVGKVDRWAVLRLIQ